jgi:hypothetical protein
MIEAAFAPVYAFYKTSEGNAGLPSFLPVTAAGPAAKRPGNPKAV